MDFTQRGSHPNGTSHHADVGSGGHKGKKRKFSLVRLSSILLLFSTTVLVVALLISMIVGGPKKESKYINNDKLQAVFLNGGQVYFGTITNLNDRFMTMKKIYYLRVNQTVQPDQANRAANNDVSLVKLGCELHGPEDEMVINREHVMFWENLKADGQVTKAVETYVKQNPNGQQCNTNTNTDSNQ